MNIFGWCYVYFVANFFSTIFFRRFFDTNKFNFLALLAAALDLGAELVLLVPAPSWPQATSNIFNWINFSNLIMYKEFMAFMDKKLQVIKNFWMDSFPIPPKIQHLNIGCVICALTLNFKYHEHSIYTLFFDLGSVNISKMGTENQKKRLHSTQSGF